MTTKWIISGLFGAFLVIALGALPAAAQSFTVEDDVTVASGEAQDHVFTLGGNIVVDGRVRQSVAAVGGSITVSGEVGDAVVGIGSRIVLKSTAVVKGDVVALGGTLEKEPGCSIRGDTVYFRGAELREKIFKNGVFEGLVSLSVVPVVIIVELVFLSLWLVAALIGAVLFPKPIALAAGEIRRSFWASFGIGLLAHVAFGALILLAVLLSLILIGIPLFLALLTAGFVIWVFARLALFYFFGDSLLRAFGSSRNSAIGAVLLGLLIVGLISLVPILGLVAVGFLNVVGWGAVIRTRFGTRSKWPRSSPPAPTTPAP
jgi:hypothetical protein